MKKITWALVATVAALVISAGMAQASTKEEVQKRGVFNCGVSTGLPGFSIADEKGVWTGIDVDVCKAIAAATLGDASKIKYVPLNAKERFTALQSGEIDALVRGTTWTLTRDTSLGLNFTGVNYYDGQGFLVSKKLGVKSALELDGAAVCIQSGTTSEMNLADYFKENKMEYKAVTYDTHDATAKAFDEGRCDVLTSDQSQLYGLRTHLSKPEEAVVLPEVISKEPLGPVVRQGDDAWFNIVKWSLNAMIEAEEMGVTQANVDDMKANSKVPGIRRLVGLEGIAGKGLGLNDDWAYQIIKQVGNYGEIFERNVGADSPLKINRGLNALWSKGGIMYAPPLR
ncbi:MAG: amino acid ABC transporter substrate-binding protein [Thermodesulfobacteriota bacterium]